MINNSCTRGIESLYYSRVDSKNTRLKGMSEFLEAESEADGAEAAYVPEHGGEATEEHLASRLRQTVAKCALRYSTEAGSSHKKARRGPEAAAPLAEP